MLCRIGWHRGGSQAIENAGIRFGACARCGCALIQRELEWETVPKGLRVVWRPRGGERPRLARGGGELRPSILTGRALREGSGGTDWAALRRALTAPPGAGAENPPGQAHELTVNPVRSRSAKAVARA